MRASRLLSILTTLQARGRVTAETLAAECEVSVRTIYRDIDALSSAGIPVYAERGAEGGYRLLDGYRVRLNGLSDREAEVLVLAGLIGPAASLGLGAELATAEDKLIAALPEGQRHRADHMRRRFHLDLPGWFGAAEQPACLAELAEAVWTDRMIEVRYQSWKAERTRRLQPLGLVLKSGAWYLIGYVDGGARTYRVSRILDLTISGEGFERPEDFDLAAYWRDNTERLEEELHPGRARIRLSPQAARILKMTLSPYTVARLTWEGPPDAEGWRVATLPVGKTVVAAHDFLRFGAGLEVLDPPDLRAAMAHAAAGMVALYGGTRPEPSGTSGPAEITAPALP